MDKQHFVYAINCGTYDADGYELRIFGVSSLKSFANRYRAYMPSALIQPELVGVVPCDSREEALATERAILSRLWKDAPTTRNRSEIRRASEDVLDFIETEMMDGTEFLGMTALEFANEALHAYQQTEQFKRSQRAYWQKPGNRERRNERQREYSREYRRRPEVKARQRLIEQQPERKAYQKRYQQAYRQRKNRGGNSPGQLSFL